jgi:uncharacterized membrane protein
MWNSDYQQSLRSTLIASAIFCVLTLTISLNRYYSFYANTDHGLFNQVAWNSIHGHWFESTLFAASSASVSLNGQLPEVTFHSLSHHFAPAMALLFPIYALFPYPSTLVVFQVLLMTAGGVVLYFLARHYLKPELAVLITVSYYAANSVIGPTLGNFFELCQLPLYTFSLILAMEKKKWLWFWLLAALVLMIREDAGIALFSIGFYWAVSRQSLKLGIAVCTVSLIYIVVITNTVMPLFGTDLAQRFMIDRFGQFVETPEASTLDILWGMVSQPGKLLIEFFVPLNRKVVYLLGHWLSLGLIPVASPAVWLNTAFPLSQLFLQQGTMRFAINIRYAVALVPGIFYGTVLWWSQHPNRFRGKLRQIWKIGIGLSLFFTITSSPHESLFFLIPDSIDPWIYNPLTVQWNHVKYLNQVLAQIPADASVCSTQELLPRLSGRRVILPDYLWQFRNEQGEVEAVDYLAIDFWRSFYRSALKGERGSLRYHRDALEGFIADGRYGLIDFQDGVALLKKGEPSRSEATIAWSDYRQQLEQIFQQDT